MKHIDHDGRLSAYISSASSYTCGPFIAGSPRYVEINYVDLSFAEVLQDAQFILTRGQYTTFGLLHT